MDEFRELLGKTQEVAEESQKQDVKPEPNAKTSVPKAEEQKPKKANIKQDVFITNAKIIKTEKRKLQQ